MKPNWYVLAPLLATVFCAVGAGYWGFGLVSKPDISVAIAVGVLIGLAFTGIMQSLYRAMLADQDETIDTLIDLTTRLTNTTQTQGEAE